LATIEVGKSISLWKMRLEQAELLAW